MENIWLPDQIRTAIEGRAYEKNNIGMSGSQVFLFEDMVLKIQNVSKETENEVRVCKWLRGKLPVPEIIEYTVAEDKAYCLMTRIHGKMLCEDVYMNDPELLLGLVTQALKLLWSVDIRECPCDNSLDIQLEMARYQVENNLVQIENAEPETFGKNGFSSPAELFCWLEDHRQEEELVFSHGDFCLPNVLADGDKVTGFIDLGRMGIADRWRDIAICDRSLRHNFEGAYNGGIPYKGYSSDRLLKSLGIKEDKEKCDYYILLDELF